MTPFLNLRKIQKDVKTIPQKGEFLMSWDEEKSRERVKNNDVPPKDIEVIEPEKLPNLDALKTNQMAMVEMATLFVDICHFTKRTEDQQKKSIFRILNTFHQEINAIAKEQNVPGVKVAIQGDRDHIVFCSQKEGKKAVINAAVNASISMLTSVEKVINPFFSDYDPIKISIGIDYGTIAACKLGYRGEREPILIGNSTNHASKLEDAAGEQEIIASETVYETIENEKIKKAFVPKYANGKMCYSLQNKTWDDFEEKEKAYVLADKAAIAAALDQGLPIGRDNEGRYIVGVENGKDFQGKRVHIPKPSRVWSEK